MPLLWFDEYKVLTLQSHPLRVVLNSTKVSWNIECPRLIAEVGPSNNLLGALWLDRVDQHRGSPAVNLSSRNII